ncbi:MAG: hypothetical protein J5747_02470 [Spirochaetaceae bacterium]|nr:hypothetical protein [Spirochaetaceae bacterium]
MSEQDKDNQDGLHFYYDRDERLKNAPRVVKDFYNGNMKTPERGLIRVLVANKASRIMFLTLVFLTALGIAISLVERSSNTEKKDGVRYSLTAFSFDESIYVAVKLDENSGYDKNTDVNIVIAALDKTGTVVEKNNLSGTYSGKESFFRTTFYDYDIMLIEAVIKSGENSIVLTAPVEKR